MDSLKFARLYNDVKLPSKREEDGGLDIYARFDKDFMILKPRTVTLIPTGLISAFSSDYVMILKERGSTGTKGMEVRCGVMDSGFRGEWVVALSNSSDKVIVISKLSETEIIDKIFYEYNGKERKSFLMNAEIDNRINPVDVTDGIVVYPYEKAICQACLVVLGQAKIKECTPEEIRLIESERGEGKIGSSSK